MLSLAPILKALTTKPVDFAGDWFRKVEGAAEYAQVNAEKLPAPTCWVVRGPENATHAGERAEVVNVSFDVVMVISNARNHRPNETDELLLNYRHAVKKLLLGEKFENMSGPIKYNQGRPLRYSAGDLVWADKYSFEVLVTNYKDDPVMFEQAQYTGDLT